VTGRNRVFAAAGKFHLGERLDAVLKLLPEERREAIARRLDSARSLDSLRTARKREQLRIERVAHCADADPRLKRWMIDRLVTRHGRD